MYIGCSFPPFGINIIKVNCFPLFNTVLLVYSGLFLMFSLEEFKKGSSLNSFIYCIITIILGLFFVLVQFIEYTESFFSFNDSCYGSVFFLLTGFHGFHVIVGLIFLSICCYRLYINFLKEKKDFLNNKLYNKYSSIKSFIFPWKSLLIWINYHGTDYNNSKNFNFFIFLSSRIKKNKFLIMHTDYKIDSNIGLICGSWYWHFVDAIWIVVISVIYSDIFQIIIPMFVGIGLPWADAVNSYLFSLCNN